MRRREFELARDRCAKIGEGGTLPDRIEKVGLPHRGVSHWPWPWALAVWSLWSQQTQWGTLAGWWVAGCWRALGIRAAWVVWIAYTLIDLAILVVAGMSLGVGALFVASFATKLAAVLLGARRRLARQAEPDGV